MSVLNEYSCTNVTVALPRHIYTYTHLHAVLYMYMSVVTCRMLCTR